MKADQAAVADQAPLIGQENLEKLTLGFSGIAVEGQVRFDRADTDVGDECDHVGDLAGKLAERRACLGQGLGKALDLDDKLPGHLVRPVWSPAGERADAGHTGPDGWNVDVLLEALLGQEACR